MTTTLLTLKNWFARFIGENDYSSLESVVTSLIDDAHKEVASLSPFYCFKATDELTTSSGSVDLPTDLDISHIGNVKVYRYDGTTKYEYERVDLDNLSSYDTSDYVYAIDFENSRLKLPTDVTVQFEYYFVPTTLSDNTDTTKFPIPKAIARMAAFQYWQSFEEDPDQAKINLDFANSLIVQAQKRNKMSVPYRAIKPYGNRQEGFNE